MVRETILKSWDCRVLGMEYLMWLPFEFSVGQVLCVFPYPSKYKSSRVLIFAADLTQTIFSFGKEALFRRPWEQNTVFFTCRPPDSRVLCVSMGTKLELRDQDKRPRRETWLAELTDPSEGVGRSVLRFVGSVWGQMVRVCWRSPGEQLEVVSVGWSWQCVEHAVRGRRGACALPLTEWEL